MENEKLEVTLNELAFFLNDAAVYQKTYPKERSKLTFLLIKQSERYNKMRTQYTEEINRKIDTTRCRHASVDDKENLLETKVDVKAGRGEDSTVMRLVYKKEAKIKCEAEVDTIKKDYEAKKIEIEPPYAKESFFLPVPENFDFTFLTSFKKFIFDPQISEEDELKIYLAQNQEKNNEEKKPTVQSVLTPNGQ